MLVVVALFFSVACSAIPTSDACSAFPTSEDGTKCLAQCLFEAAARNSSDDLCVPLPALLACSKSCPSSRVDAVVQQITLILQKECSPSVFQEERDQFLQYVEDLSPKLARCEKREPEDDEALCKNVANCLLGSAFDELKDEYPTDVITYAADWMKLFSTFSLKDPKSPPEACSILYEPYKA